MQFDERAVHELLEAARFAEAIAICDEFLACRGTTVLQQVHALLKKAAALRRYGGAWSSDALDVLADALSRLGDGEPVLRARVLVNLMAVYADIPDSHTFADLQQQYLAICALYPEASQWQFEVWFNAGVNATYMRDYPAAAAAYEQALRQARTETQAVWVKHNLAFVYIQLLRLEDATSLIEQVRDALPEQYRAKVLSNVAHCLLASGDLEAVAKAVDNGLAHKSLDSRTEADLRLVQARLALRRGDKDTARRLAFMSMDLAYRASYRAGSNAACKFLEEVGTE